MIVLTAPTSNIGHQVLTQLLAGGARVRVIAREPAKLSAQTRAAVEVIEGSHSQATVVDRAFSGADTVFWLVPADSRAKDADSAYSEFARPGCEALRAHGIQRVVGISALGRGWPKNSGHVSATLKMDDMIAATGVAYRALACASFMDNVLRQADPIKTKGVFFGPIPADLRAPTCATRDIAGLAARLLLDPSWTGVDSIPVLGPEDLSFNEMAGMLAEVLGTPVRYQQISMDDLKASFTARGMSEGMTQAMVNMYTAKSEGMDNMVKRTPELTSPTSFRQWCVEVLQPALRT